MAPRGEVMDELHYVVTFRSPDEGKMRTLRVRHVGDSDLGPGFVCLSGFVFHQGTVLLPHEESLQRRFEHTRRLHLNIFNIQSIAEEGADNPGVQLDTDRSNLLVLPSPED